MILSLLVAPISIRVRAEDPVYNETVIAPIPDPGPLGLPFGNPSTSGEGCGCGGSGPDYSLWTNPTPDKSAYYLSGFAGPSYFDTSPKTSLGGMYGLDFSVPVLEQWGVGVSGMANHYDGGSQYFLNTGVYRWSTYYGDFAERIGADFSATQFTDTGLNSPYFILGDLRLNYAVFPGVRTGVEYTFPIHGDNATFGAPGGGNFTRNIRPLETVKTFVRMGGFQKHVDASVGYVEQLNTVTYGLDLARPVNDRISITLNSTYDQEPGLWTGFLGFQVDLSPQAISPRLVSYNSSGDVVRGESSQRSSNATTYGVDETDEEIRDRKNRNLQNATRTYLNHADINGGGGACNCPASHPFLVTPTSGNQIVCRDAAGNLLVHNCP
ncbi:MAG: hypothetical protein KDA89_04870 [Planctomycetaceae bacterium]|nr:hypothetical protein [Planctomycetaceae bacterium]